MKKIADYLNKSAVENVKAALVQAQAVEAHNALISLTEERALERAKQVDAGKVTGKLAGVPFVVKDNFLAFGGKTTAASKMLKDFEAPYQATAIERLEAEGAICIGKANLDAFAHGSSTERSAYGVTKNAHDDTKVAGGSSGGSAVAVALGIVPFALGSDTGGSIRQPASFNGVVGVKPTYGMVSRYGVVGMASSTDTVGVLANDSTDAGQVMGVIAGQDKADMTTLPDYFMPLNKPEKSLKIAIVDEFMSGDTDPEVAQLVKEYAEGLEKLGHVVERVSIPSVKYAAAIYYVVSSAELSSNMARFDSVRYGERSSDARSLGEVYTKSRDEFLEREAKLRILLGSLVLTSGYYEDYYLQAQKVRTLLIQELQAALKGYDVLVGPVAPAPAFEIGKSAELDPAQVYHADILTAPASLAGLPAISVPAGQTKAGLPVGVQLIGAPKTDAQLLALANSMEVK